MLDTLWEEFWWNHITGAQVVVSKVTSLLLDNAMVILKVPSDLPWRHAMRGSIHAAFQQRSDFEDVVIELIDAIDDNQENLVPGRFVLQRFASSTVSRGYREKSRITVQQYIMQKDVIKNRIIWIKGLTGKTAEEWVDFCKGFAPRTVTDGLFVLEIHGNMNVTATKYIQTINYSDSVSNYDVQLFNSFVLDGEGTYSNSWKKYIAVMAALICDIDVEVSERLLRETDFRKEEPIKGIQRISKLPEFKYRGLEADSAHVLWYYQNGYISEIKHRVWAAQVQILFPIIEFERESIIRKWEALIKAALEEEETKQYGEIIKEPIDVELGTLCYMMARENGVLYIPDENARRRIRFLHECRNLLAHASCCTSEQVSELLR